MKLMTDNTRALKMAAPKPVTSKPLTVTAVSQNIKPFMTSVNKPSVNTFKGSVNRTRTGRIMAFTIPRKIEPTIAPQMVSSNPVINCAVMSIAMIYNNHLSSQPFKIVSPFQLSK